MLKNIKGVAFYPPCIVLFIAIIVNFVNEDMFIAAFTLLNTLFMEKLGWFASIVAIGCLIACIAAMFSKFGNVKLGGKDAKPRLSTFSWFSISLTSTLASGILIWGAAEPIYHIMDPATDITGIEANSAEAAKFAMETMYMHWTFIPYAIMSSAAVVFAYIYFNCKGEYSVSSQLAPVLGKVKIRNLNEIIDGLVLFCIAVAIAASLGQGLLNIIAGINAFTGIAANNFNMLIVCIILVILYIGTAVSGVEKGMKICADVNVYGYILVLAGFLFLGPTAQFLNLGTEAFGGFLSNVFERSLWTGAAQNSMWPQSWTTFYWASYFAWTPTIGLFLGSISYGRTIRQMLGLNFVINGAVSLLWMTFISGTAIHTQMSGAADLIGVLVEQGVGALPYAVLNTIPLSFLTIPLYLIVICLTFITAANANVSVMAGLSSRGMTMEDTTGSPWYLKTIWGVIVAAMAYIMTALIGIDGVKVLANISGIIAVFIIAVVIVCIAVLIVKYKDFDKTGDPDYTEGEPDENLELEAEKISS